MTSWMNWPSTVYTNWSHCADHYTPWILIIYCRLLNITSVYLSVTFHVALFEYPIVGCEAKEGAQFRSTLGCWPRLDPWYIARIHHDTLLTDDMPYRWATSFLKSWHFPSFSVKPIPFNSIKIRFYSFSSKIPKTKMRVYIIHIII